MKKILIFFVLVISLSLVATACTKKSGVINNENDEIATTTDINSALGAGDSLGQVENSVNVNPPNSDQASFTASEDCEAACGHYVTACLTFVPNATQALFDDGYNSCLGECAKWNDNKVSCMISAFDCEAMTEVCGL